ncbi:hypothetical protein B0H13DRAFT_2276949, partial [Mycena leptocephala]
MRGTCRMPGAPGVALVATPFLGRGREADKSRCLIFMHRVVPELVIMATQPAFQKLMSFESHSFGVGRTSRLIWTSFIGMSRMSLQMTQKITMGCKVEECRIDLFLGEYLLRQTWASSFGRRAAQPVPKSFLETRKMPAVLEAWAFALVIMVQNCHALFGPIRCPNTPNFLYSCASFLKFQRLRACVLNPCALSNSFFAQSAMH